MRKKKEVQQQQPPPPPPPQAPQPQVQRVYRAEDRLCGMEELIESFLEAYVADRERAEFYRYLRSVVNVPLTLHFKSPAAFVKCASESCVNSVAIKTYLMLLLEIYTTTVEVELAKVRAEQDVSKQLDRIASLSQLKRHVAALRPLLMEIAEGVAYTTVDAPPPYVTKMRALGCRREEEREEEEERP